MKAKLLIQLLQRLDSDTEIEIYDYEGGITKFITLWDWTETHGAMVLVGITNDEYFSEEREMKEKEIAGVKCKVCGAQAVIVTPTGRAYCESCVTTIYGLRVSRYCTHCGQGLKREIVFHPDGDVFCSIDCAVNHRWENFK